jgi:phosphatidylglycerophosphatase A
MADRDPRNRPVSEARRLAFRLLEELDEEDSSPPGPRLEGFRGFLARGLGSFFGVGFLPLAPGTWGSLAALVIYVMCRQMRLDDQGFASLTLFVVFVTVALACGGAAERTAGKRDPKWFVLDEMAGVFLALYGLAGYNLAFAGVAFLLFRFFDITKVAGIRFVEMRLKGSVGIVADDLVAASLANLPVRLGVVQALLWLGWMSKTP